MDKISLNEATRGTFAFSVNSNRTRSLTIATLVLAAAYIGLAYTLPSVTDEERAKTTVYRLHSTMAGLSALAFSISLAIWGAHRFKKSSPTEAGLVIVIGSLLLVVGTAANEFKDADRDTALGRVAKSTLPTFPALIGMVVGGVIRFIGV